jgi:hypothetical protein
MTDRLTDDAANVLRNAALRDVTASCCHKPAALSAAMTSATSAGVEPAMRALKKGRLTGSEAAKVEDQTHSLASLRGLPPKVVRVAHGQKLALMPVVK